MTMQKGAAGEDLFDSMYRRYRARMLRFFRQVFHVSEEDAEELTQDSFLRFFRAMAEYRGEAEWGLLETIARNVGYNRVRSQRTIRRGAYRTESLDGLGPAHKDPEALQRDPVDRLIEAEYLKRLREAILQLSTGQRHCLQLRLDGLSYEEIAAALRISTDAVRSRIRDAKRSLRQRLGDEAALPEE
jgi:RNA polymerase sigma-70 factor, ECF subfamily